MEISSKALNYIPLSSSINPSFWNKLTELKLNVDKLEEKPHHIWGFFCNLNNQLSTPFLEVDSTSFNTNFDNKKVYTPYCGKIVNKNTIELFKECNKTEIINNEGKLLWENIKTGVAIKTPAVLNQFFVLSFADLKKYHYYYWFAFPVPHNLQVLLNSVQNSTEKYSEEELEVLLHQYLLLDDIQKPYFIVYKNENNLKLLTLDEAIRSITENNYEEYIFGFLDTSLDNQTPGSNLRNYMVFMLYYCPFLNGKSLNILSLRLNRSDSNITCKNSLIFNLKLPEFNQNVEELLFKENSSWVGWEKNERDKLGPRLSNMKNVLDPTQLAESSVDLNLKLMKWRIIKEINLDKIKQTKCLILGSGTLGCSVARILLGWGVRNIHFVDNSTVSFSNPVRQSLFTYEDSVKSRCKAEAAADNLKRIFPGVNASSTSCSIPMPGHPVGDSVLAQTKDSVDKLVQLIQDNDVVFLLMDSRESRWLPTLLGAYFGKIVINAALGFDSYLVMRHGTRTNNINAEPDETNEYNNGIKKIAGSILGCYFCNDVTAPGNSTKDRTLDQQCTVTRPGISAIAGALAVELLVSLLQHEDGADAPAFYQMGSTQNDILDCIDNQSVLGLLPHSIRGFLSNFSHVLPATEKYKQCVACSDIVLKEYKERQFDFLLDVFNSSKYLEDLTGLSKICSEMENIDILEFSDDDSA